MKRLTSLDLPRLPKRPLDAHKGSAGRVLVVAGSYGMAGAAYLAAQGAYAAGAGYVRLACPESIYPIVASMAASVVFIPLECDGERQLIPGAAAKVRQAAAASDVAVIGPGLGESAAAKDFFRRVAADLEIPSVIDASGLALLALSRGGLTRLPKASILTPHPGEAAALLNTDTAAVQADREAAVTELSKRSGTVIVLKGQRTLVSDGDRVYENTSGNAGMACAGAGDVLSGAVAALRAQGMEAFDAASLAAFLHGKAGDIAARALGRSLTAEDILESLPEALWTYDRRRFERGGRRHGP